MDCASQIYSNNAKIGEDNSYMGSREDKLQSLCVESLDKVNFLLKDFTLYQYFFSSVDMVLCLQYLSTNTLSLCQAPIAISRKKTMTEYNTVQAQAVINN